MSELLVSREGPPVVRVPNRGCANSVASHRRHYAMMWAIPSGLFRQLPSRNTLEQNAQTIEQLLDV
jgi:hypothetical protein